MRCPKSRQAGEGGGDKQCQCASCLTDAVQESNIWQVFKYQLGGRIELSSLFTWEASYHIMKEMGMIFQPLLTILTIFPLFTPCKHFYFKKHASHSYESAKIYSFSQTNMTASCQGNKGGLEEDSGHWEGMHLLWKAVGQCWGKACQNALEKLKWPDHYKRSVRVLPSSFGRSCSWVQSCDGWARGI